MDWRRFAIIALVISVMFGTVVLVGISQTSPLVIITSMLATTIAVATPLTLGALSGIFGCIRVGTHCADLKPEIGLPQQPPHQGSD